MNQDEKILMENYFSPIQTLFVSGKNDSING